jgi:hypothetical protein
VGTKSESVKCKEKKRMLKQEWVGCPINQMLGTRCVSNFGYFPDFGIFA